MRGTAGVGLTEFNIDGLHCLALLYVGNCRVSQTLRKPVRWYMCDLLRGKSASRTPGHVKKLKIQGVFTKARQARAEGLRV